ncbi:MAG: methylmalonyl Co-A mutase-associated GTPase MeaB [Bacteroidota bacterium]
MSTPLQHSHLSALEKLKKHRQLLSVDEYVTGILAHDRAILAQAITLIESTHPDHYLLGQEVVEACLAHSGKSLRIGITGVPGVGKSTFIEAFGIHVIEQQHKIAVLAIDPSSQRTGGSILGDKTRMEELSHHPSAFIRPTPSASTLGGVARKTRETIILCEAAGFDVIVIETVGVGQSETEVKSMVDFFLLLMLAGAGDELQGIKRGIMEMADTIAITKADSGNEQAAKTARQNYKNALHLFPANENGWIPQVEISSSLEKQGIEKIWEIAERYRNEMSVKGWFTENRRRQALSWMEQTINLQLQHRFHSNPKVQAELARIKEKVANGELGPFKAAELLLSIV